MTHNEKLKSSQKALQELDQKRIQAEKDLQYYKKSANKHKRKFLFKSIILVLLLFVAVATYLLVNNDGFMASITEKLTKATVGTEDELGFWLSSIKETMNEAFGQMEELIVMLAASLICVILATIGAGGKGLAWGLITFFLGLFGMVYFFKGTHIIGYLPIPVCIIVVAIKIKSDLSSYKKAHAKVTEVVKNRDGINAEFSEKTKENSKLEENLLKSVQVYKDAKANGNDEALMRKAAELGNDEAIKYINALDAKRSAEEGEKIYAKATATENVDEELMKKAAELGSPKANLYIGKKLCQEVSTGVYTSMEKKDILTQAVDHLDLAANAKSDQLVSTEAEFWSIACKTMYKYKSYSSYEWQQKLARLRAIKKNGLPSECNEVYDALVKSIVEIVDSLGSRSTQPSAKEPKLVRKYCAFNNCGLCTYYSTASNVAKCTYMNNPGNCSAALLQKALRYEFE